MDWGKLFKTILQVEEDIVPVFIHNPQSQKIAGVVLLAESVAMAGAQAALEAAAPVGDNPPKTFVPPAAPAIVTLPEPQQPPAAPVTALPANTAAPSPDSVEVTQTAPPANGQKAVLSRA